MDLFDILEKAIRGVVFFLYNLIETTLIVLRHPLHGPAELHRRHKNQSLIQMGGLTYLFVMIFLLFSFQVNILSWDIARDTENETPFLAALRSAFVNAPTFNTNVLWPEILAALVTTVIIDGLIRLLLRLRLPRHPMLRQTILASSEYAMLWLVIAALIVSVRLYKWELFTDFDIFPMDLIAFTAGIVISAYPAAAILTGKTLPLGSRVKRGVVRLTALATSIIFFFGLQSGVAASSSVQAQREKAREQADAITLETLHCILQQDGRAVVQALAQVKGGSAIAIEPSDVLLDADDPMNSAGHLSWPVQWTDPKQPRIVILSAGQPQLLELTTTRAVKSAESSGGWCALEWSSDGPLAKRTLTPAETNRLQWDEATTVTWQRWNDTGNH